MKIFFRHFKYSIFIILGSVILAVFALSAIAFTEPTALPPNNNVPPPITISGVSQRKAGSLTIDSTLTVGGILTTNTSVSSPEFCLAGACITVWPTAQQVAQPWTVIDANSIYYSGSRVGIGITNPVVNLHIQNSQDNFIRLDRERAPSPTIFRQGTDGAFVINNNAVDALKIYRGSLFSSGNVYGWSTVSGAMAVGFGELQKMVTDFPGVPVTGVGWYAATGQIGALVPQNQIFGIYVADPVVPQTPTSAHFYVTGDILSRDAGWTAPMRESSGGAGTISGNSLQWRWAGASTSGKLRLKTDNTQFIIPTCSIGGNGFCVDSIEPLGSGAADLNTSSDFELRCPGNEVMRGIKWEGAIARLSLICTR